MPNITMTIDEAKAYIEKLRTEYIENHKKAQERDELIGENAIEQRDVNGYHGREILELLQNADDAYQKSIESGEKPSCDLEVYAEYKEMLSPFGIKLVQGMSRLSARYPADIAYNVLCVGNTAFALWNKTDRQICRLAEKQGVSRITVAQGYARCSTLPVGDGIISADPSICHAAKSAGLKVLTVSPGHILLPGYDYGFIGGASGLFEDDTVAFFGDPDTHPEGLFIRDFIKKQGCKLLDVPKRPLVDIGTILRIDL